MSKYDDLCDTVSKARNRGHYVSGITVPVGGELAGLTPRATEPAGATLLGIPVTVSGSSLVAAYPAFDQTVANATARKAMTGLQDGWKVKDTDDGHIYTYALVVGLEASDANWTSD